MTAHCTHWDSWMVGPGRIVSGEICCKCSKEVEDDDQTECSEVIGDY